MARIEKSVTFIPDQSYECLLKARGFARTFDASLREASVNGRTFDKFEQVLLSLVEPVRSCKKHANLLSPLAPAARLARDEQGRNGHRQDTAACTINRARRLLSCARHYTPPVRRNQAMTPWHNNTRRAV